MNLYAITQAIRNVGGQVVLCGPTSFGYIVRASIGGKPCRIITPATNRFLKVLPLEPGTETHIVSDTPSLQIWLSTISNA